MNNIQIQERIEAGVSYLLSHVTNGLCREFSQLRHGPSWAWSTACVGSSLSECVDVPEEMIDAVLALQRPSGGWSYNQLVPPDADSTLRVLQFLRKARFTGAMVVSHAEQFVWQHQQPDGGLATFLPQSIVSLGYPSVTGWVQSHPDVSALACNVLSDCPALDLVRQYLGSRLTSGDYRAYWWRTPLYVLYEARQLPESCRGTDSVELSLLLLLQAKHHQASAGHVRTLTTLQRTDGSFQPSRQFRIPRPSVTIDQLIGNEEIVEDRAGIFSTSAAVVALSRQQALLN